MRMSVLDQSMIPEGSTPADALRNTIELARAADEWGYHRYWLAEHHATPSFASPAPEVMVSRVSAETRHIRVGSGGVLLPYYSAFKIAEVFRVLQALAPGRIDLGIGRGAGAGAVESRLLNPHLAAPSDAAFTAQLDAVRAFLEDRGDGDAIMPSGSGTPQVWLLGASPSSAAMAGRLGLPYSFAHFGRPEIAREAIDTYRQHFDAGSGARPQVMAGIGVYCAPTQAEADHIFASQRLFRHRMGRGDLRPVPTPETALAELPRSREALATEQAEWPRYVVGPPELVHDRLTRMAADLGIDEFVALSTIHSHKARLRSYELLAEVCDLDTTRSSSMSTTE